MAWIFLFLGWCCCLSNKKIFFFLIYLRKTWCKFEIFHFNVFDNLTLTYSIRSGYGGGKRRWNMAGNQ